MIIKTSKFSTSMICLVQILKLSKFGNLKKPFLSNFMQGLRIIPSYIRNFYEV